MIIITDDPIIRCGSSGIEFIINNDMLDSNACFIGEGSMSEQYEHDFVFEGECIFEYIRWRKKWTIYHYH